MTMLSIGGHLVLCCMKWLSADCHSVSITHRIRYSSIILFPVSLKPLLFQEDLFDQIVDRRLPEFPAFVPVEARSLLQGLLHKGNFYHWNFNFIKFLISDANHRLGGGERDASDVMDHPFFAQLDFEKLKRCEIEPPYVPRIRDQDDTNGFDRCFTQQPIDSYSALESYQGDDGDFPDFSYQNAETHHQEFSSGKTS